MNEKPKADSLQPKPGSEEAIFAAALAQPPEARTAFLTQACGKDALLHDRLQTLLSAHEQAGEFLEPLASPADPNKTVLAQIPAEKAGDVIGHYKIREKVGEGGFGVVYVAEQTEPVRRRVALKVIKLGMDTRNVIARFEAERQALSMMDHPNIARVLDAGATETGRPYFVMELVRGIKITDYCDQNHLDTAQRLDLFIQVCHAVQHAHQKGIIHRDIKPSNILVTLHDGVPVPKVIDFGIAKATEGRLTDLTVYTELNQFIGTPAYMSPEQAEMSGLDIDTRSDIYSLGVLLYELLTERTPFETKELLQAGLDQMRRTIREKEPMRPSTRLSTMLEADLTAVAKRHGEEAPRLIHLIKGDLDWIVMKALEKDRTRRFETANSLAADVQRFLKNEPVQARPPSRVYLFQKLMRRNKAAFGAAGAVALALVLGLAVSFNLYLKEKKALRRAIAAERQQAALREEAERGWALEKRMREISAIGEKLTTAGQFLSQGLLDKAEEIMNGIPLVIPQSVAIFDVLGDQHGQHGEYPAAMTNYLKAVQVNPTNHVAYHYLAPLLLQAGDLAGYGAHRERILRQFGTTQDPMIAERMAKDCLLLAPLPPDLETIGKMADVAVAAGPTNSLWPYFQFAKGLAEFRQGHFDNAAKWLQEVTPKDTDVTRTVQAYMVLAMAQYQLKKTDDARATLTTGLKIAAERMPNFKAMNWNDRLSAHFLMEEAKRVLGQPPEPQIK
jgi:serine/threonine protein kinase/Flp pilus assembly protein TadD